MGGYIRPRWPLFHTFGRTLLKCLARLNTHSIWIKLTLLDSFFFHLVSEKLVLVKIFCCIYFAKLKKIQVWQIFKVISKKSLAWKGLTMNTDNNAFRCLLLSRDEVTLCQKVEIGKEKGDNAVKSSTVCLKWWLLFAGTVFCGFEKIANLSTHKISNTKNRPSGVCVQSPTALMRLWCRCNIPFTVPPPPPGAIFLSLFLPFRLSAFLQVVLSRESDVWWLRSRLQKIHELNRVLRRIR